MELNYKDFEIGQKLICIKLTTDTYNDDERLILNEIYTITDLDFHFPNKVCVKLKGPYYHHQEFVPIECFSDVAYNRELKLNQLGI